MKILPDQNLLREQFSEGPTKIQFDILVSSFGPIQDIDMVCHVNLRLDFSRSIDIVIHDELLFSSTLA